jgi:hypothetical protein
MGINDHVLLLGLSRATGNCAAGILQPHNERWLGHALLDARRRARYANRPYHVLRTVHDRHSDTLKSYFSKWIKVGISKEDRNKIYHALRMKAYVILKNNHKREYSKIVSLLIKKEYVYYKNLNKQLLGKEFIHG